MTNSKRSLLHTGEGIVIDLGTGDGRFVSAMARANPNKFFIGLDANVKPLEKPSMKATRKPNKGGLPNVMFVQAAIEFLPEEFAGAADEIHIHFPWGSLLQAIAAGDEKIISELRRIAAPGCLLEIVLGIDPERDRSEIERLGLPPLTIDHFKSEIAPKFVANEFIDIEQRLLRPDEWPKFDTTWAKKLSQNSSRQVMYLVFRAES
jgi:16S rRNA (adenine(1408)-N(1))-methyltransferase